MRSVKTVSAVAAAAAAIAFAAPAAAQTAAAPEVIVLKAAHIFDATGTTLRDGGRHRVSWRTFRRGALPP
jgi:anti-sigma-K factor RskA